MVPEHSPLLDGASSVTSSAYFQGLHEPIARRVTDGPPTGVSPERVPSSSPLDDPGLSGEDDLLELTPSRDAPMSSFYTARGCSGPTLSMVR